MNNDIKNINNIEKIFESKKLFHKELAKLSFEEKIKILIKLQEIANDIKLATGRKTNRVWKI